MKHTPDELLDIVYRYYPRGVGIVDGEVDMKAIHDSEEHARLVAARRTAARDERIRAMRRRIEERFPEASLVNRSLHLPSGSHDACHSFTIDRTGAVDDRVLWFHVSFLAPYYVIHGSHTATIVEEARKDCFKVNFQGLHFQVSRSPLDPQLISNVDDETLKRITVRRDCITFDLLPEERPYAERIAREIETTFGCEPMPQEIGTVLVPNLATPKLPGEIRLYDCLFSDQHEWVTPPPSDATAPIVIVDANRLTEPFIAALTVLAALCLVWLISTRERQGSFFFAVETDGVLRKEELLEELAEIRRLLHAPTTARGMAAKGRLEEAVRELEALVMAWDGDGAPPAAMVAWASSILAHGDAGSPLLPR